MLQKDVADGVHRVEDSFVNWYLVEDGGRLTAVDAGLPSSWKWLERAVDELGRSLADVEALVLTHGHVDHIGCAERLRTEVGVPVWINESDVGLTKRPLRWRGERPIPLYAWRPAATVLTVRFLGSGAVRTTPVEEHRTYAGEGPLDVPGSPHVVFTPGHTRGHCSIHLPDRGVLLAGDALVTYDPYTGARGPRLMPRCSNGDTAGAVESLGAIAATGAATVLPGHGEPWTEGAERAAEMAADAGSA